jgi:hypothetical protein
MNCDDDENDERNAAATTADATTTSAFASTAVVSDLIELISDADLQVAERVVRVLLENRDSLSNKRFRELRSCSDRVASSR